MDKDYHHIDILYIDCLLTKYDKLFKKYIKLLPKKTVEKIARFRRQKDREMFLYANLLLIKGLSQYGYPEDCLYHISQGKYGRPYIDPKVDFNVSRSGSFVVCALTRNGKVGIDIERIKPIDLHIYKRVFNSNEWEIITSSEDSLSTFYSYWTIKESVLKADGRGFFVDPLNVKNDQEVAFLEGKKWYLNKITVSREYCCYLASNLKKPMILIGKAII
ncbi:4'-phosphopantetheinyl transferase family protein [Thermodesulfobacteriota bacterium]